MVKLARKNLFRFKKCIMSEEFQFSSFLQKV